MQDQIASGMPSREIIQCANSGISSSDLEHLQACFAKGACKSKIQRLVIARHVLAMERGEGIPFLIAHHPALTQCICLKDIEETPLYKEYNYSRQ